MNNLYIIIIGIILFVVLIYLGCRYSYSDDEQFCGTCGGNESPYFKPSGLDISVRQASVTKYIVLDRFNKIKRKTFKMPLPRQGETSCYKITCPQWFMDEYNCYRCE